MQTQNYRRSRIVLATLANLGTTLPSAFDPVVDTKKLIRENKRAQFALAANTVLDAAVRQIAKGRGVNAKDPKVYQHLMDALAGTAFDFEAMKPWGINPQLITALKRGSIGKNKAEIPLTVGEQKVVCRYLDMAYTIVEIGLVSTKDEGTLNEVFGAAFLNQGAQKIAQYFGQDVAQG